MCLPAKFSTFFEPYFLQIFCQGGKNILLAIGHEASDLLQVMSTPFNRTGLVCPEGGMGACHGLKKKGKEKEESRATV